MMKKVIVILAVVAMVAGAVAAYAGPNDNWVVQIKASDSLGGHAATACQFGTKATGATVGIDSGVDATLAANTGSDVEISATDLGGTNNRWYKDLRAPLDLVGNTKQVWNLSLFAGPSFTGNTLKLALWNPTGANYDLLEGTPLKVELFQLVGSDLVSVYKFDPAKNGTSSAPAFTKEFAYTAGTPINFQLIATVPEPGSMLAMLSGLVGLVGFGIRRRK